jgi:hypothetical protein
MRVSTSPTLAPQKAERVTSVRAPRSRRAAGSASSSSAARSRRCCHHCVRSASELAAPPDPTGPSLEPSTTTNSRFVSYRLDTPAPPVVAHLWHRLVHGSEELSPPARSPERPADAGSGWNPAATLPPRSIPTDPARQETPGTNGTQSVPIGFASQHQCASGDAPGKPRRASLAPATPRETSLRTSNVGMDSRRIERVTTLAAEQHADRPATKPSSTGSRLLRAETRAHRSPAEPGGLDGNADTNRRLRNRRLDTTVHPHDIGAGDVATTAPARASLEVLGVR